MEKKTVTFIGASASNKSGARPLCQSYIGGGVYLRPGHKHDVSIQRVRRFYPNVLRSIRSGAAGVVNGSAGILHGDAAIAYIDALLKESGTARAIVASPPAPDPETVAQPVAAEADPESGPQVPDALEATGDAEDPTDGGDLGGAGELEDAEGHEDQAATDDEAPKKRRGRKKKE